MEAVQHRQEKAASGIWVCRGFAMNKLFIAVVLLFSLGICARAWAQRNADTLIAIHDGELETGSLHGIPVKCGQALNVYHRSAGRLWVVVNAPGSPRGRNWGWIDASYAIPPDQAVKHFSDSLQKNPKDSTSYLGRANAELVLEQNDKVIADCNQVLRLDPKSVTGLFLRARAWVGKELADKAIADLNAVLGFEPERTDAYRMRGDMWLKQKEYGKAIADYSHLLHISPSDCESYYCRGLCRIHEKAYAKALADFEEVLCRQPDASYGYLGRGEALFFLHAYERAEDDLTDSILLEEKADMSKCAIAWRYFFFGDFRNALAGFDQTLKANVHRADAYLLRADCRSALGESDRALADINEALWINPNSSRGHGMRGLYWMDKKRFDLAMADLDSALKLDPKFSIVYHALRGSCLAMQGQNDKAQADFEEALRLGPNDQRACNSVAWFRATCVDAKYRDGQKAVVLGTKACQESNWGSYATIDTLAAAYAETGNFAEAVRWQKKALELAPPASKKKMADRLALFESHKPYRAPVEHAADPQAKSP
jgi:tetratricopeptide (TPR) repeat protein